MPPLCRGIDDTSLWCLFVMGVLPSSGDLEESEVHETKQIEKPNNSLAFSPEACH